MSTIEKRLAQLPKTLEGLLYAGVAYSGFRVSNHPMGAVYALLGLKLANAPGILSNAIGCAILANVGISNMPVSGGSGGTNNYKFYESKAVEEMFPSATEKFDPTKYVETAP